MASFADGAATLAGFIGSYLKVGQGCARTVHRRGQGTTILVRILVAPLLLLAAVLAVAIVLVGIAFWVIDVFSIYALRSCRLQTSGDYRDGNVIRGGAITAALSFFIGLIAQIVCWASDDDKTACTLARVCWIIVFVLLRSTTHNSYDDDW